MTNRDIYIGTPYTYLIGWSKENLWYYGCRYAKGCDPSDLWVKYFTSSKGRNGVKGVLEYRKEFGEPDVIQIRKRFDNIRECQSWEKRVLSRLNVVKDDRFINRNNGMGILDNRGRNNPRYGCKLTQEHITLLTAKNSGPRCDSHSKNISNARKETLSKPENIKMRYALADRMKDLPNGMQGRNHSKESRLKMSIGQEKIKDFKNAKLASNNVSIGKIHKDDPRWKSGEIISEISGWIIAKCSKTGNKIGRVTKDDPRWKSGEICGIAKIIKEN